MIEYCDRYDFFFPSNTPFYFFWRLDLVFPVVDVLNLLPDAFVPIRLDIVALGCFDSLSKDVGIGDGILLLAEIVVCE